ncbi:MAG: DEAD/DEAH box helicase [Gammaproteobacteria bacterium]|nr:DEAD/DEAH box helicase [Gammaproteobacteria bacterium]
MTFVELNLDPRILKAVETGGYKHPTPVQERCIPEIIAGKDVVASAQTGTGKTAAFVLPALQHLMMGKRTGRKPRILILTPTRELASQITQATSKYGKFLQFNMANLVGGMPYGKQIRDLSRAVDVVVATPGRLLDHLENRRLDLSGIEMLILDEADRMLDMGFIDDVQHIAKSTPANRQTLLFSATIDSKLSRIVKHLLNNPVRIDLSPEQTAPSKIIQKLYVADNLQHKTRLFQHFLENENIFKAIIFSATKVNADKIAATLCHRGLKAAALHGDLNQNKRNRTIDQLRYGKIQYLVATDVAARGLDVADISHVINYDLPRFCEDYVHRIGRTGRAGKSGIAVSFALPMDVRHLQRIEKFTSQKLKREIFEGMEPSAHAEDALPLKRRQHKRPSRFGAKDGGRPHAHKGGGSSARFSSKRSEGGAEKSYGKRSEGSSERSYGKRSEGSSERSYGKRSEGSSERSYGKRSEGSSERSYGKRSEGSSERSYGKRSEGSAQKSYGKRSEGSSERTFSKDRPEKSSAGKFTHKSDASKPSTGRYVSKSGSGKFANKNGANKNPTKQAYY